MGTQDIFTALQAKLLDDVLVYLDEESAKAKPIVLESPNRETMVRYIAASAMLRLPNLVRAAVRLMRDRAPE